MWKKAKVTIGDVIAEQAMVDFSGKVPAVLEWPSLLPLNTEVIVADETCFAGDGLACAGNYHMPLMRERRLAKRELNLKQNQPKPETELAASEVVEPAAEPIPEPPRKGKKP